MTPTTGQNQHRNLSTQATAGLIVLAVGLLQLTTYAVQRVLPPETVTLGGAAGDQLRRLDELHNRFDADGVPLWYVPRGIAQSQQRIAEELATVSRQNAEQAKVLERLAADFREHWRKVEPGKE